MATHRFCARPGIHAVVLPTAEPDSTGYIGCLHIVETGPIVKEMVPIDNNLFFLFFWTIWSAGRFVAASPALSANTCMTSIQTFPLTCSISGPSGGSLSRIVTLILLMRSG